MNIHDRSSNLLFLCGMASLCLGCPGDDTGTSEGTPTTSTSGPGGSSSGSTTGGGPGGSSAGDGDMTSSTTDPSETASTGSTTEADSGSTGFIDCSEPGPPVKQVSDACVDLILQYDSCYNEMLSEECIDFYAAYCQYGIDQYTAQYGDDCGTVIEEYYVCVSALSCEELEKNPNPCPDEQTAIDEVCKGALEAGPGQRLRQRR